MRISVIGPPAEWWIARLPVRRSVSIDHDSDRLPSPGGTSPGPPAVLRRAGDRSSGRLRRMRPLSAVERFFERLFERPSARLFRARLHPVQVLRAVERAMERERRVEAGRTIVPDRFTVRLHPADLAGLAPADGLPVRAGVRGARLRPAARLRPRRTAARRRHRRPGRSPRRGPRRGALLRPVLGPGPRRDGGGGQPDPGLRRAAGSRAAGHARRRRAEPPSAPGRRRRRDAHDRAGRDERPRAGRCAGIASPCPARRPRRAAHPDRPGVDERHAGQRGRHPRAAGRRRRRDPDRRFGDPGRGRRRRRARRSGRCAVGRRGPGDPGRGARGHHDPGTPPGEA